MRIFDGTNRSRSSHSRFPVVIPPAYGPQGVGFETFTGDGPVSYWNSYVAVTQMGGHGSFSDPRIGVSVTQTPDLVTPKLAALRQYQESLRRPAPPAGSFDRAAARRGSAVFSGTARCATCHIPPTYTDVMSGPNPSVPFLHDPLDSPTDKAYAARSATKEWRTTPLRGDVAAPALLPRRQRRGSARRGQSLQHGVLTPAHCEAESQPSGISEVLVGAMTRVSYCDEASHADTNCRDCGRLAATDRCQQPSMAASSSFPGWHFVWWKGRRLVEETREITAEEIGAVPFEPLRGFAQLLNLSARRTRPSGFPRRTRIRRHEINLRQLPPIVFKRDACHRPVALAGDHDETICCTEPDLEWVTRSVSRGHYFLEPESSEE